MPIPQTTFNANECQCLLDVFDRLMNLAEIGEFPTESAEELAAVEKLVEAGKFYVPDPE